VLSLDEEVDELHQQYSHLAKTQATCPVSLDRRIMPISGASFKLKYILLLIFFSPFFILTGVNLAAVWAYWGID